MSADGTIFLTGATGFVGSHVLGALQAAGYRVRALVRPETSPERLPAGCEIVHGDLRRPGDLIAHLDGCRALVHVAALYSFNPSDRQRVWDTNVHGCAGLLESAHLAGVERAIVTSSSAAVGPAPEGRLANEADWAIDDGTVGYHGSKVAEERAALAARIPATVLLPTTPVGPNDWKPTPTGKMIVDFIRGRIFASLGGGLNVVPVEDVAEAHVLALRAGQPGERYLLGGENLTIAELWAKLAPIARVRTPRFELPYRLALALGWADEYRCRLQLGEQPLVPLEGVHMARHRMWASSAKAERELGYRPGPVEPALERAVRWYRDHGYVA